VFREQSVCELFMPRILAPFGDVFGLTMKQMANVMQQRGCDQFLSAVCLACTVTGSPKYDAPPCIFNRSTMEAAVSRVGMRVSPVSGQP
jgi:hypothetical protein